MIFDPLGSEVRGSPRPPELRKPLREPLRGAHASSCGSPGAACALISRPWCPRRVRPAVGIPPQPQRQGGRSSITTSAATRARRGRLTVPARPARSRSSRTRAVESLTSASRCLRVSFGSSGSNGPYGPGRSYQLTRSSGLPVSLAGCPSESADGASGSRVRDSSGSSRSAPRRRRVPSSNRSRSRALPRKQTVSGRGHREGTSPATRVPVCAKRPWTSACR
jgi:hypothetical protein